MIVKIEDIDNAKDGVLTFDIEETPDGIDFNKPARAKITVKRLGSGFINVTGRVEAQINKITYSEPIRVTSLSKKLCDMLQLYTQNGGVRPFGSALIIGGVYDGKCKLFETDPSGALIEYKATAIGSGRSAAMEIFEEKYEDDLTLEGAIELALTAINEATDHDTTSNNVEIAVIKVDDEKYVKLSQEEVQNYIDEVLVEEEEKEEEEEDVEDEVEESDDSDEEEE